MNNSLMQFTKAFVLSLLMALTIFAIVDRRNPPKAAPQRDLTALPSNDTEKFSFTPRSELVEEYKIAWLLMQRECIDQTNFSNWVDWQCKFDGTFKIDNDLTEKLTEMIASRGDSYQTAMTIPDWIAYEQNATGKTVGLAVKLDGNKISYVYYSASALTHQLEYGDEIESIDGLPTSSLTKKKIDELLRGSGEVGSKVTLVVRRKGKHLTFQLEREVLDKREAVRSQIGTQTAQVDPLGLDIEVALLAELYGKQIGSIIAAASRVANSQAGSTSNSSSTTGGHAVAATAGIANNSNQIQTKQARSTAVQAQWQIPSSARMVLSRHMHGPMYRPRWRRLIGPVQANAIPRSQQIASFMPYYPYPEDYPYPETTYALANTGAIRIDGPRSETVIPELIDALKKIQEAKVGGILLDLRDCKGGSAHTAAQIAALFLADGKLVNSIERADGKELSKCYAIRDGKLWVDTTVAGKTTSAIIDSPVNQYNKSMVVLVNHGTAGATELVAAALQESHRGTIYGDEHTSGKESGQRAIILRHNVIILTTSRHRGPSNKPLEHVGVQPDILATCSKDQLYGQAMLCLGKQIEQLKEKQKAPTGK